MELHVQLRYNSRIEPVKIGEVNVIDKWLL